MWRRLLRMLLLAIAVLSIPVLALVIVMITVGTGSIVPILGIILAALANTVAYWWYRRRLASRGVARYLWGLSLAVVIIGLVAPPLFFNVASRARVAKAQADARALTAGVEAYRAQSGRLPASLADLAGPLVAADGSRKGPIMLALPTPPAGWSEYRLERLSDTKFRVTTTGDGTTVAVP